jgi:large subunit ribosomal protein L18e
MKKLETISVLVALERAGRKTKKPLWTDLAEKIMKPRRRAISINVDKVSRMAEQLKAKVIVVPGKILSQGEFTSKATVTAFAASEGAIAKINKTGKYIPMKEFAEKADSKGVMIVK